jgi:hypothetical protein
VLRVLTSMALLDAVAVGGAIQWMEEGRAGEWPASLSADVTANQAADVLWLLTSFDSFDLLYTGWDLSVEKTATALIAACAGQAS